jgi:3-dehydroquinate synthase
MSTEIVRVELGERSYPIHVVAGGLGGLGQALAQRFPLGRVVLVTNPVVGSLYAAAARAALRGSGFEPVDVEVPDGEAHQGLASWSRLLG